MLSPALSTASQDGFVRVLLTREAREIDEAGPDRVKVERALRASTTQAQVQQVWREASRTVREEVAPLAVEKLTEPAVEAATEHELQKFAVLLDGNPRRIKRFLNTYTSNLVTTGLDQSFPNPDTLALWTIVRVRWPMLADVMAADPSVLADHHMPDAESVGSGGLQWPRRGGLEWPHFASVGVCVVDLL
jgi:hypothetical protein